MRLLRLTCLCRGLWYDDSMLEALTLYTQALTLEAPWLLPTCFALLGACIGSFLNVVIYRMPRGLSVREPSRSFCPHCKTAIPWYFNLPIVSWLMLRGRGACCGKRIALRYWLVEVGCAAAFAAISWAFAAEDVVTQALICTWAAAMLATFCIDCEHMIVLPPLALTATAAGVAVAALSPWLVTGGALMPMDGLLWSACGALGGFALFRLVALLGRLLFGRRSESFGMNQPWSLRQEGDDLELRMGEERLLWSELFMEEGNRLTLHGAATMGQGDAVGELHFSVDAVLLPDGRRLELENCDLLQGTCNGYSTRREAMGSGDAWIALAIGALCGWQGVVFALVGGSLLGILWALAARIGRGQPMPFGPALTLAATTWLFRGQPLWYAYLDWAERLAL